MKPSNAVHSVRRVKLRQADACACMPCCGLHGRYGPANQKEDRQGRTGAATYGQRFTSMSIKAYASERIAGSRTVLKPDIPERYCGSAVLQLILSPSRLSICGGMGQSVCLHTSISYLQAAVCSMQAMNRPDMPPPATYVSGGSRHCKY